MNALKAQNYQGGIKTSFRWIIPMLIGVSKSVVANKAAVYALHITPLFEVGLNWRYKAPVVKVDSMAVRYTKEEAEASEVYAYTHPHADACDGFLAACIAMREQKAIYNEANLTSFMEWVKTDCERVDVNHPSWLVKGTDKTLELARLWDYYNDNVAKK